MSLRESEAEKEPAVVAEKATEMVQVAAASSEEPQVFDWAKLEGLVPVMEMLEMESAPFPVLESVTF